MLRAEVRTRLGDLEIDVALDVPAGTCLALAGPSGAGKSSVLRAVAGLLRPDHGVVTCDEAVWTDTAARVHRAPDERRCGVVFQDYALFGHLSAWRNVAYPLRGLPRDARRARAHELLGRLGLAARADARPATLSGGERQRVALARALATDPAVLLLDEPLSALDARTRRSASGVLAEVLRDAGVPAVLVTHDFAEAAELADRVAILDHGRIVQEGTPAELVSAPATAFVADLTGAFVLHGIARAAPDGTTIVALPEGAELRSTDAVRPGPVAASLHPWDVALEPPGAAGEGSARNRLPATVRRVTHLGGRVRVALDAGQPLACEVTPDAVRELGLCEGARVTATFKAAATRLVEAG